MPSSCCARARNGRFNDLGRTTRLHTEMAFLSEQLSAAVGFHGKDRKVGAAAERARLMITKRIKDTLKKMAAVHPILAQHLGACVKTGYLCRYMPPPEQRVEWER